MAPLTDFSRYEVFLPDLCQENAWKRTKILHHYKINFFFYPITHKLMVYPRIDCQNWVSTQHSLTDAADARVQQASTYVLTYVYLLWPREMPGFRFGARKACARLLIAHMALVSKPRGYGNQSNSRVLNISVLPPGYRHARSTRSAQLQLFKMDESIQRGNLLCYFSE